MIKEFVFASTNRGKLIEVREAAGARGIKIVDPLELVARCGAPPDVEENAETYEGNAQLKATAYFSWCQHPVLADDTGLGVTALAGKPGVHSARYAGAGASAQQNRDKLLAEMNLIENRAARFVCYLCFIISSEQYTFSFGKLEGAIARVPSGEGGFGYDSIFLLPELNKTLAQLKGEQAVIETHRTQAFQNLFNAWR